MLQNYKKTYSIDNETITTDAVKLGDVKRLQPLNSGFALKAVSADVTVKMFVGYDIDDETAFAEKTLENTTISSGTTNIYEMQNSAAAWVKFELASTGTTNVEIVGNVIIAGGV